ncbi:MAG: TonB-dependent receptor, partial [Prevotella salivae]|nr:TonB-dependent receptor [Segatella salivae]
RNRLTNIGAANPDGSKPVWTYEDDYHYKELTPYRSSEGKPLYSYYLLRTDGVFQTDAEAAAYVNSNGQRLQPKAKAGDLKFVDIDQNGSIGEGDYEFRGNAMPKMTYAFSAGFSYKKFSFDFMLQGSYGAKLFNAYKYTTLNEAVGSFNRSEKILKALEGPTYDVPRISMTDDNDNFGRISDWYLESGSYLRMKNISISYSFSDLLRKLAFFNQRQSTLDLTLSCDNLFTITPYSGIDPEVGGVGLDCGQYPVSRTISLGVKIKF